LRALENNIINRLYYSSNKTLKNSNTLTTKNSSLMYSPMNTKDNSDDGVNIIKGLNDYKNTSKGTKKINFSDFTNYLDKLANYENKQKVNGKKY
jgi:uncharacterized protein involved in high-affinity Fe2+ transport